MDNAWKCIEKVLENNNGYIKTSEVEAMNISRHVIKKYVDLGKLNLVRKGLYVSTEGFYDEFALLQARSAKAIYSYSTALYLLGLSDRVPNVFDLTFPRGTNATYLKKSNAVRCHYVDKNEYEVGITEVYSPQGALVKVYNRERCICDLIRNKNQMDIQIYTHSIKTYFKSKPDYRTLIKYGKIFGIVDQIRTYMEVLN